MTQKYEEVLPTDFVDEGLVKLSDRDLSTVSNLSGDSSPVGVFPQSSIFNDLSARSLKLYDEILGWVDWLNYESPYDNQSTLNFKFQSLNETLSNFSDIEIAGRGLLSNGVLIPMSSFFPSLTGGEVLGLSPLAYKDNVSLSEIENNSIGVEKFNPRLQVGESFAVGEILRSFRNDERVGFLKMSPGSRVGGPSSNANHKSLDYYNLFKLLVSKDSSVLYDSGGNVVEGLDRTNPSQLFDNGVSVSLPTADVEVSESEGDIVTFKVNQPTYFKIEAVGGGGGGGGSLRSDRISSAYTGVFNNIYGDLGKAEGQRDYPIGYRDGCGGASGSVFVGIVKLQPDSYEFKSTVRGGLGGKKDFKYDEMFMIPAYSRVPIKGDFSTPCSHIGAITPYSPQNDVFGYNPYTTSGVLVDADSRGECAYLRNSNGYVLKVSGGFSGGGVLTQYDDGSESGGIFSVNLDIPKELSDSIESDRILYSTSLSFYTPSATEGYFMSLFETLDVVGQPVLKYGELPKYAYTSLWLKVFNFAYENGPIVNAGMYCGRVAHPIGVTDFVGSPPGSSSYLGQYGGGGQPGIDDSDGGDGQPGLMRVTYLGLDPDSKTGVDISELTNPNYTTYIKY